jgi:hypothetical protein
MPDPGHDRGETAVDLTPEQLVCGAITVRAGDKLIFVVPSVTTPDEGRQLAELLSEALPGVRISVAAGPTHVIHMPAGS